MLPIIRIKCITDINTVHLLKQSFDYNHMLSTAIMAAC